MVDQGTLDLLIYAGMAIAIAAMTFAALAPRIAGDEVTARIQTATASRTRKVAARTAAEVANARKRAVSETLKELEGRRKNTEKRSLKARLAQAGIDAEPRAYWIASAVSAAVFGIIAFLSTPASIAHLALPLGGVAALVGGLGFPGWMLNFLIRRRQNKFLANLANAIDVVVRGIKTGLPLNECLAIIARESPEPIASEFREVVDQQRVGVTLGEALDRLVVRMPLPEVKFLAIVIAIQQSSGGNLSEALGNLSQVLRDRFGLKLKVKALSAEALASAMVLGSLPPAVIVMLTVTSPTYLQPLFDTKTGNMLVLFGAAWMAFGIFIMKKMINFKY
ncbi:MAG: type II secretion system F family protein [Bacteroidales bacterium]|nr:type II secretion system F family protein [Bacteroidales bacterium]